MRPLKTATGPTTAAPLPPELEVALAELLAQALVAELVESANAAPSLTEGPGTVASPPGPDREEVRHVDQQH